MREFPKASVPVVVPSYLPTPRLWAFQKHRVEYGDFAAIKNEMPQIDVSVCEENVRKHLAATDFDYAADEAGLPKRAFININHNYDVFYGNAGLHTRRLGNLFEVSPPELLEILRPMPPNYDWSAYYDLAKLPSVADLLQKMPPLSTNYVYSRMQDCIYSWLDNIGVANKIIF